MKQAVKWGVLTAAVLLCGVLLWRWAYAAAKHTDNIPALASLQTHGEAYANEELIGYKRAQILSVWGEPDGMLSGLFGDIWDFQPDSKDYIILYYNQKGIVESVKFGTKDR